MSQHSPLPWRYHGGSILDPNAQVRMCGNSVSPANAHALVRANYADPLAIRAVA